MKKILLILCISLLTFVSCKKEDIGSEAPKTSVTFAFSDFSWDVAPLGKTAATTSDSYTTGDTLQNHAKYFYYRAYNSSGIKVSEKSQNAGTAGFGTINDNLDPGTYTIVFAASNKPLFFSHYGLDNDHLSMVEDGYWTDTFFEKITVTVGTESATHQIKLARIVGALEVTLLDVIPTNAARITLSAEFEHGVYQFQSGNTSATDVRTKEFILTAEDKGEANRTFLMHILNVARAQKITIRSYDSANTQLAIKTIENVNFFRNRKTTLRGNLSSSSQFAVTVDPVWGTPTAPITF